MFKSIMIGIAALLGLLLLIFALNGFDLGMKAFFLPKQLKVERMATEQSRSFTTSQNEMANAFLADAARTKDPAQRKALVNAACGVTRGMDPSTVYSEVNSSIASFGGCQ